MRVGDGKFKLARFGGRQGYQLNVDHGRAWVVTKPLFGDLPKPGAILTETGKLCPWNNGGPLWLGQGTVIVTARVAEFDYSRLSDLELDELDRGLRRLLEGESSSA